MLPLPREPHLVCKTFTDKWAMSPVTRAAKGDQSWTGGIIWSIKLEKPSLRM